MRLSRTTKWKRSVPPTSRTVALGNFAVALQVPVPFHVPSARSFAASVIVGTGLDDGPADVADAGVPQ